MASQISSNGYSSVTRYRNPHSSRLEQHVFYIGNDGTLNDAFWDSRRWDSRVLRGAAPAALTNPIAVSWSGSIYVFYRDVGGRLATTRYAPGDGADGDGWQRPLLLAGMPVGHLSGSTYAVNGTDPEAHVYFVEASGNLAQTFLDRQGTFKENLALPGTAHSAPALGVSAQTYSWLCDGNPVNEQHVFFRGPSGSLEQAFAQNSSTGFLKETLPGMPGHIPAAVLNDTDGQHVQSVVFVDESHDVLRCWEDSGTWEIEQINAKASGSVIGGTYLSDGFLELHVFYLGPDGELEQSWQDRGGWHRQRLGVHPSLLLGVGTYRPDGGRVEQHVFWRDSNLGLNQSWYDGVSWQTQLLPTLTPVHDGSW